MSCSDCQNCNDSNAPCVELPPPPDCDGEECVDIKDGKCIKYTGPSITCLGIVSGDTFNTIIQKMAARVCSCCSDLDIECEVSDWSLWSSCVDGYQTRTRVVIQDPSGSYEECPPLEETRECCTPQPCTLSSWSSWSACVDGFKTRTRTVLQPASCGGNDCGALIETVACGDTITCGQPTNLSATPL